jgi:hypothetical protein
MIMTHLSPLQSDLQCEVKSLVSQHGEDVSLSSAESLVSEFKQLVGSVAQETSGKMYGIYSEPVRPVSLSRGDCWL